MRPSRSTGAVHCQGRADCRGARRRPPPAHSCDLGIPVFGKGPELVPLAGVPSHHRPPPRRGQRPCPFGRRIAVVVNSAAVNKGFSHKRSKRSPGLGTRTGVDDLATSGRAGRPGTASALGRDRRRTLGPRRSRSAIPVNSNPAQRLPPRPLPLGIEAHERSTTSKKEYSISSVPPIQKTQPFC